MVKYLNGKIPLSHFLHSVKAPSDAAADAGDLPTTLAALRGHPTARTELGLCCVHQETAIENGPYKVGPPRYLSWFITPINRTYGIYINI